MTPDQFHQLLQLGVQHGASDIHFRPGSPPTYRVNGTLAPLKSEPLRAEDTAAVCMHVIRDARVRERLDELTEYDTSYALRDISRFRVNIYRQRGTMAVVMRLVSLDVPTLDSLALPPVLKTLGEFERGLVLITGATGSGKSTTLAALVHHINQSRRAHILTIEDPIEYVHTNGQSSISQREIGLDTPDFQTALRAALRQDPDVLLIAEIRDQETMDIALKASETGHAVYATVHTSDATKTVGRVLGMFPPEEQGLARARLADNLRAVCSQRLLPRADGKGRVLAAEIMIVTGTVQEYIRDEAKTASLKDVIEAGRRQYQMQSFDQHLTELYKTKQIALKTAVAAASNPADFQRALAFDK